MCSHADLHFASSQPGFGMVPAVLARLQTESTRGLMTDADYLAAAQNGPALMRAGIDALLEANGLDALVHATASGSDMASLSGYTAVLVPAGPNAAGVSVGVAFQGTGFSEPKLLAFAYAFEQKTKARQVPALTPPLP